MLERGTGTPCSSEAQACHAEEDVERESMPSLLASLKPAA